jgi:hypothetical protein
MHTVYPCQEVKPTADGSDGQISITVFDAFIRCLNVVRFNFGKFVMFYIISYDYG